MSSPKSPFLPSSFSSIQSPFFLFNKIKWVAGFAFVLFFPSAFAQTQGLCTLPSGAVQGSFSLSSTTICSGQAVTLTDNSGGAGVSYVYNYEGTETPAELAAKATTATTSGPLLVGQLQVYTILQIGKKSGKDMYACRTLTVRPDSKPIFSYSICNNRLEIIIPQATSNDFDYYEVTTGTTTSNVSNTNLPYENNIPIPANKTIKVEGFYTSKPNSCPRPNAIIIPNYTPTNFPNGYDQPNHPSIDVIRLKEKTTAEITISGSYITTGYNLFMTQSGKSYDFSNPLLENVSTTDILRINLPDTTNSYCFQLQRNIPNCGIEDSAELCTNLITKVEPLAKENQVHWIQYPMNMTDISNDLAYGRYLNSIHNLQIISPTRTENVTLLNGIYNDSNFDCSIKQCYQLISETSGQLYYHKFQGKSISNEICIDRKKFNPPPITDVFVTVNNVQKNEIIYSDNSGWALNKTIFSLKQSTNPTETFTLIDSSSAISATLVDQVALPDQSSYCYQIEYEDECGSVSLPSPTFCSVYLSDNQNGTLSWTPESPFADNSVLPNYEVIWFDETTNNPAIEMDYALVPTSHPVDFSHFTDYATYQIKSIQAGKISESNVLKIPIQPKIFLPHAFSPNGDAFNESLAVKGTLGRITSFSFSIYNNWGELIFQTSDKNIGWDGKINGTLVPAGTYYFRIKVETNTSDKLERSGQVVLLR